MSFAFCDELDTVNPSPSSVDFADAYVAPTTDGTVSCSLPLDTYTLMVDPCSIEVPGTGSRRVTAPEGTASEFSSSTDVLKPRSCNIFSTVSLDWPTKPSGTLVIPEEIYSRMVVPFDCLDPAAGLVRVTLSLDTVSLSSVWVLAATLNPAASNAARASSCDLPLTSGTVPVDGPAENHTLTTDPRATFLPPAGDCLVNVPFGSVEFVSVSTLIFSPTASSFSSAPASVVDDENVGTVTISVCLECMNANTTPQMAAITASDTTTAMMMRFFLRCSASRCWARVSPSGAVNGFAVAVIAGLVITGLVCVVTVAGVVSNWVSSVRRRPLLFAKSVSWLNVAAIGTPPFINVRISFLNSVAVAYRF